MASGRHTGVTLIKIKGGRRQRCEDRILTSVPNPEIPQLPNVPSSAGVAKSGIERFEPPGGILVWIIVFVELITFGAGFVVFVVQAGTNAEVFESGRAVLNQPIAFANTIILLTGGWCMANGITALRLGRKAATSRWMGWAIISGLSFMLLKGVEYAEKIQHGIGLSHDEFFTLYYLLTGFHFLHVLVAVVLLIVMRVGVGKGTYDQREHQNVESSGIFWHMCDLIWLLLYPIIYLLP